MSANSNTYIVGDYSSDGVLEVIAGTGINVSSDRVYPVVSSTSSTNSIVSGALAFVTVASGTTSIKCLSSATFTGKYLISFNVAISSTGWSHKNDSFIYWEAGDDTGLNDIIKYSQVGVNVDGINIYFANSFIIDFGTSPNAIRVDANLNNFQSVTLPTLNGLYYAIKLS